MPVKTIDDYQCFRCKKVKGPVNRWWLVKIEGAVYSFRDFQAHALNDYDYALCGTGCLSKDILEHTDKIIAATSAGPVKPGTQSLQTNAKQEQIQREGNTSHEQSSPSHNDRSRRPSRVEN